MKLSLVITIYNEEENIKPLIENISDALQGIDYEVILVDDGSNDNSVQEIKKFATNRIRLLILSQNFGQTAAMAAGIQGPGQELC